jgi:hypothetical protein
MNSFLEFLDSLKHINQKQIISFCHHWLTEDLGLHHRIRYRIPFYDDKQWICYLNPIKKEGVEFVFLHGNKLDDPEGFLESKGRKMVKGKSLYNPKSIPLEQLEFFIIQSIQNQH